MSSVSTDNDDYKTPGQLLNALLAERGWSQRILAIVLEQDETGINKIVADKRPVSAALAVSLEAVFEVPAERFLDLQQKYDLAKARLVARPDPKRATRAHLFGGLPVSDMIKRQWLNVEDVRDVAKVESELMRFFGASSIQEIEILPHAAKKTNVSEEATPTQLAWLRRVKQIASEMLVAPFTEFGAKRAVGLLKEFTLSAESIRKIPRVLSEAGIRYVIVESLPGAKIDGVCFWLEDTKPVIGMSMRHDRIDNFWFVLRHELEHVIQGHGKNKIVIDAELEGERAGTGPGVADDERIANSAAAEFCVPKKTMDAFIARKAPFFAERDILGVAATLRVHPGLVAGQLQHQTMRYDRFRNHLVKVRSIVAPSALVDGWGDVVPLG